MHDGWSDTFEKLMRGAPTGLDRFESPTASYPWGRVYGGQVVAQALWAAGQTVEPRYLPHSLHAYFIRGGLSDRPLQFFVERTRDGRSFMTRHVLGRQDGKVMLEMTASFHTPEPEEASLVTATMPFPAPSSADEAEAQTVDWSPFYLRLPVPSTVGQASTWARFNKPVEDSALMRACAMAFISDDVPTEAVLALHPDLRDIQLSSSPSETEQPDGFRDRFMSASLDHAIWFHQIAPADEWQLHTFESDIVANGRGMTSGRVFATDGSLLATVMQEVVIRAVKPT